MLRHLQRSASFLRVHPGISVGLGAAVVVSLCSVCAGIGLVLAPWFVCELLAVQLEASGKRVQPRGVPWVLACVVVVGMVLAMASAGWLAALAFGPDLSTADDASAPLPWPEAFRRIGLIAGALALAVAFTAPFLHAPLVLLHRGGRIGGAILESAALMRASGRLFHSALSFLAQALCLSPALLSAMVIARTIERAATPLGIVAALPLLPLSIPLGLGLVTSAYVALEPTLGDPRRAQRQPPLPLLQRGVLVTDVVAPLVGLFLIGASALLPRGPLEGPASGREVASMAPGGAGAVLHVPDTSLAIEARGRRLHVVAGHEEVLEVPARWHGEIERVRVVRERDRYGIELTADGRVFHVEVDAAGVRVDDSVRRRLRGRLSGWLFGLFLVGFVILSVGAPLAFASEGERRSALARGVAPPGDARRISFGMAVALCPIALGIAGIGALAFFAP